MIIQLPFREGATPAPFVLSAVASLLWVLCGTIDTIPNSMGLEALCVPDPPLVVPEEF